MRQDHRASQRPQFLLTSITILCLALWVRLADLYSLPVFIDEANHLIWAQRFSLNNTIYPLFMDGKFLMGVLVAQFQPWGPGPLWIGRAVVSLFSMLSVAACIAGGSLLGSRKAGLLAGLFYALLPQAVFHERQLLADPLMAAFGSLAIIFTLRLAMTGQWRLVAPLAVSLAAAFLAKFFGGLYLVFLLLVSVLLPASRPRRRQLARQQLTALVLAAGLVVIFVGALYPRLGYNDQKLVSQQVGLVGCPPIVCQGEAGKQLDNLQQAFSSLGDLIPPFVGWPLIGLACAAWLASSAPKRAGVVGLSLSTLCMLAIFISISQSIPPRYVSFMAMPVALLSAYSLVSITGKLGRVSFAAANLAAVLVLWPMANTAVIVVAPVQARLPRLERLGFSTGVYATAVRQGALAVLEREADRLMPPVVLTGNVNIHSAAAYFDRLRVDVRGLGEAHPADLGRWLFAGQNVYVFDEWPGALWPGLLTREIGHYSGQQEGAPMIGVWQVTGLEAELRREVYREVFIKPEKLAEDYEALADSLPQTESLTLLVYPPNQIDALASLLVSRPNINVYAVGDSWPLDSAAVERELAQLTLNKSAVEMVFAEETKGDPKRLIETWLTTHIFRLGEQWFGSLRVVSFAGSGEAAQTIPVDGQFGEAITLESVEVIDAAARPGDVVRLRLIWRANADVARQLKVFVHVFAGEGIAAQYDGQPVGELRPTTTWHTGEKVIDQIAIRLPIDVQPGQYQLRIGMYDINTQERLPLRLPDGASGEFFVGGLVAISK